MKKMKLLQKVGALAMALAITVTAAPAMSASAADIAPTGEDAALIVTTQVGDHEKTVIKSYTRNDLETLAGEDQTKNSYLYNKGGTWNLYAVTKYVTIEALFDDAQIVLDDYADASIYAIAAATTAGSKSYTTVIDKNLLDSATKSSYQFYPNLTNADSTNKEDATEVPVCLALQYSCTAVGTNQTTGELAALKYADASSQTSENGTVLCSGTLQEDIDTVGNTAKGNRLNKGVTEINISIPETLTHVPAVAATCTTSGNAEYWICQDCGKMYSDAEGKTEISEIQVIAATGHSIAKTEAAAATTTADGHTAYYSCTKCNEIYADAAGTKKITSADTVISAIADASLSQISYTYTGKAKMPSVVVKDKKGNTISNSNYTITTPAGRKNVGTYQVKITFKNNYSGTITKTFKIVKASQKLTAKKASVTYKKTALNKAAKTFNIGASAKTALSYKVTATPKNAKKYISVSSKGKVKVKKGAKKGTYKITVTAKATTNYKKVTKTIKIVVK